jgi:hypothetical protein
MERWMNGQMKEGRDRGMDGSIDEGIFIYILTD